MTDYLVIAKDRKQALLKNTNQKFEFEHQEVGEVEEFKNGIFENRKDLNPFGIPVYISLQRNEAAGAFIRKNAKIISDAGDEFRVDPNLVRAVIYTEMGRGWYDKINPLGSDTVLPGNVDKSWESLIPGSDVNNTRDNIRLTAKLISEIGKRLDEPYPEDVYSLYNGLAHDRTYENRETKNTPYFLKQVLKARAWEFDSWKLPNRLDVADLNPEDHGFPAGTLVDEQEGTIRPGDQPGSDGVRLNRSKIFARRSDAQVDPDGFAPGKGDLFEGPPGDSRNLDDFRPGKGDLFSPNPEAFPGSADPVPDHGSLRDTPPKDGLAQTDSLAVEDDIDMYKMAEEVFSGMTLDEWAVIPDENDPFDGRDPFADGVKWVPGLGPPPVTS